MSENDDPSTPKQTASKVYASAAYSPDLKDFMVKLMPVLVASGYSKSQVLGFYHAAGYDVPERTMRDWTAKVNRAGTVVTPEKNSGRRAKLNEDEKHLVFGYVLFLLEQKKQITRNMVVQYVQERFDVEISLTLAGDIVDEGGFSYRMANTRNPGRMVDDETLGLLLKEFRYDLLRAGVFQYEY